VRLAQPVPFDAPDGKPVSLVFLLLVPEQATEQHLRVLSELAQMLSDRELREKLSTGTDAGTLHQHITAWQPHVGRSTSRSCMTTTTKSSDSPGSAERPAARLGCGATAPASRRS